MDLEELSTSSRELTLRRIESWHGFAELSAVLGEQSAKRLMSVSETAVARIAEATVTALAASCGQSSILDLVHRSNPGDIEAIAPAFTRVVEAMLRIQLVAAAERLDLMRAGPEGRIAVAATVVFADLVASTAWANAIGPTAHCEAIGRFSAKASEVAVANGGRLLKLNGDEAMFIATDPATACAIAFDLVAWCEKERDLPPVRCGLASGEMIAVDGDYHGPVVSLAARLAKHAGANQVLAPQDVVNTLGTGYESASVGHHSLRGFAANIELAVIVEKPGCLEA